MKTQNSLNIFTQSISFKFILKLFFSLLLMTLLLFIFKPNRYQPIIIDYLPLWLLTPKNENINNISNVAQVVNIAFALPDGHGSLVWYNENIPDQLHNIVQSLQNKNKIVLISIGGADARSWNLDKINLETFANNIKSLVDKYGFNGIDIDYELIENRNKLSDLIKLLRKIMPREKYYITYTASAIGAFGIANHEHPEWNGYHEKGVDIPVLTEVPDLIDWVNIMAYNAFNFNMKPNYDPRMALLSFKDLLKGKADKIALGIHLGKQDWPINTIITSKMICPSVEFVKNQQFKGIMFWHLKKDTFAETGEPAGTFANIFQTCEKN